ncbi:MAG TPA: DNA ligase D [Candidatus Saccharimonadales bacterium]|nr:DNA ligase D [Candidatus Saccharimonadales bacterium]
MALAEYKKKRTFKSSPEPAGKLHKPEKHLRFVVQKHHASQLHYDFRLELDGVLKSWAVPKGPSLNPDDKRLAMMVEDHPYEYRDFEGVIPKGNYGAGKVIVWDEGTYEDYEQSKDLKTQIKNLRAGLKKGDFKFVLHGQKLNGAYVLAKMQGRGENNWLLIKKKDDFATAEDVTKQGESVKSGLDVEAVGDVPGKKWLKTPKLNLKDAPKATQPGKLEPMLATLSKEAFDGPDWLYEIKWDGYRILAHLGDGEVKLLSRNGKDYTEVFAPIATELSSLKLNAILDGEIVVLDKDGKSDFGALQDYQKTGAGHLVYEVFDAPFADGHDLRELSLTKRKEIVAEAIEDLENVRYSDHITGGGKAFFAQAEKLGLEGIMAKQNDSQYLNGKRGQSWLKIKTHQRQEVVVGGWTEPRGGRKGMGALIVGVYEEKSLRYVGNVGGGFTEKSIDDILVKLKLLERRTSPFSGPVKNDTAIHWVKPDLLAEVKFAEWTGDGHLRQPIFLGLREDKEAQKVQKEEAIEPGGKFTPTHRDKVFWPKEKYTKGDVIDYYDAVSATILPHLVYRPQSMNRHPNGIKGASFFQKDVEKHPDWVKTKPIYSESNDGDINWLICNDRDTLLYMANLGCIELNPWHSRTASLDKPDYCLIDLDAKTTKFEVVVEVAKAAKKLLDEISADCFVKTSGKTGMHILIPLGAKYSYEQSRQFAQLIVGKLNERLPKITSVERNPDKRRGKIYLDYLQNRKGQTMAAAYCLRPVEGAPVSAPLKWSEVKKGLDPRKFNIKTMPARIKKVGDLHNGLTGHRGIDMMKCLKNLEKS